MVLDSSSNSAQNMNDYSCFSLLSCALDGLISHPRIYIPSVHRFRKAATTEKAEAINDLEIREAEEQKINQGRFSGMFISLGIRHSKYRECGNKCCFS
jgi:hypothetical protein